MIFCENRLSSVLKTFTWLQFNFLSYALFCDRHSQSEVYRGKEVSTNLRISLSSMNTHSFSPVHFNKTIQFIHRIKLTVRITDRSRGLIASHFDKLKAETNSLHLTFSDPTTHVRSHPPFCARRWDVREGDRCEPARRDQFALPTRSAPVLLIQQQPALQCLHVCLLRHPRRQPPPAFSRRTDCCNLPRRSAWSHR